MRTLDFHLLRPPGGTLHLLASPVDAEHSRALTRDAPLPQPHSHATQTSSTSTAS